MARACVATERLNLDPWLDLGRAGTAIYNRVGVLARASLVRLSFVLTPWPAASGGRAGAVRSRGRAACTSLFFPIPNGNVALDLQQ
eukprot:850373-Prymnesium_polylepis.1